MTEVVVKLSSPTSDNAAAFTNNGADLSIPASVRRRQTSTTGTGESVVGRSRFRLKRANTAVDVPTGKAGGTADNTVVGSIAARLPLPAIAQELFSNSLTESDVNSLNELIRFEPAERPPSLDQIREFTHNRFSDKWIKYMYAKFKNECPAGRMKAAEFKRLLGAYVPDRLSDAYLERLFRAFCHSSPYADQLTFKDLIVCLAQVCEQDARRNAEWTMRLISNGAVTSRTGRVNLEEFVDFVKSVFLLVGREMDGCGGRVKYESSERGTVDGGASDGGPTQSCSATNLNNAFETAGSTLNIFVVEKSTMKAINHRATAIFKELDVHNRGYLTVDNLEELFRVKTL